ncbi:NAD-binding protein [Pseudonocardia benzenivorans]
MRGRRVVVAGAGVSGLAAAEVLVAHGADVVVTDDSPERLTDLPVGARAGEGCRRRTSTGRSSSSAVPGCGPTIPSWRPPPRGGSS